MILENYSKLSLYLFLANILRFLCGGMCNNDIKMTLSGNNIDLKRSLDPGNDLNHSLNLINWSLSFF